MTRVAVSRIAGGAVGGALAVATNALGLLPRVKPLHPRGEVTRATLSVTHPWPELGVPFVAAGGDLDVLVRRSRATGLAEPWPDVTGLALRISGVGDLLLASTGTGRISRRLLTVRTDPSSGPLTTLVPLHCPAGRLDIGTQERDAAITLRASLDGGPWREIGTIVGVPATAAGSDDVWLRMDPVGNLPDGLEWSPFWRAARDPAYRLARLVTRR